MPNTLRTLVYLCAGFLVLVSITAMANGQGRACSTHASLLRHACLADGMDDYLVHIADCIYVTSPDGKRECTADAREEKSDKREECRDVYQARRDVCDLIGEARFDVEFDPADFVDPDEIGSEDVPASPYWPLTAGHTHVIVGETEDDEGEAITEVTVVAVTDETRIVGGLPCRVIRDLVFEEEEDDEGGTEYAGLEVTQDWYAQHTNGDIVYCGENTYEVEDDLIDNTDGSFANGVDRALAGYLLRAEPVVDEGDRQEMASDEAEDIVQYISLAASPSSEEGGDSMNYPCQSSSGDKCLQTFELNPRDPTGAEFKYYLPGKGFVLATKLDEDGMPTGEREEVTCIADSLEDVLNGTTETDCGITDTAALQQALCVWASGTPLCEFDD